MPEINKLGGLGASDGGKLFTRDGLKSKTAHSLILEKAQEVVDGYRQPSFSTPATRHGLFNEEEAFNYVIKPTFPNAVFRSDESILIKEGLWATPDVTDKYESITTDIKCPYTIATYYTNYHKLPSGYIIQNQQQMLATGHKRGMVCLYLTSTRIDKHGNKIEYEIDINDRHCFMPLESDETIHKEIFKRFDQFKSMRDKLCNHLSAAQVVNDHTFFYIHKDHKVTPLKKKNNVFAWEGKLVRNQETYYVIENK